MTIFNHTDNTIYLQSNYWPVVACWGWGREICCWPESLRLWFSMAWVSRLRAIALARSASYWASSAIIHQYPFPFLIFWYFYLCKIKFHYQTQGKVSVIFRPISWAMLWLAYLARWTVIITFHDLTPSRLVNTLTTLTDVTKKNNSTNVQRKSVSGPDTHNKAPSFKNLVQYASSRPWTSLDIEVLMLQLLRLRIINKETVT